MSEEFRRARRQSPQDTIEVVDTMTDRVIGRLGNLSESGMLLISDGTLVDDALYQLRFHLPLAPVGHANGTVEVGAHLLWQNMASAPGQAWVGFRFITLTDAAQAHLRRWLDATH